MWIRWRILVKIGIRGTMGAGGVGLRNGYWFRGERLWRIVKIGRNIGGKVVKVGENLIK